MRKVAISHIRYLAVAALSLAVLGSSAHAEDILVGQYGNSTSGFPYAIAMEKGFFKEAGANITGILSSLGGGVDIRDIVSAGLPYGDVPIASAVAAIQKGADLAIVSEPVQNSTSLVWVVMPNSPIQSVKDLKGKKMGFSGPQSTTQAAEYFLLDKQGYKPGDVTLVSTGGFGPGLTSLEHGGVDIVISPLPDLYSNPGKYKPVIWARDVLPPLSNQVAISPKKILQEKPDLVRSIIAGRRKAVEYMNAHREESADIVSRAFKLDKGMVAKIIDQLIDDTKIAGVPYWGLGNFNYPGMENMLAAGRLVGMISGDIDLKKMTDERYLPADLRSK